MRHLSVLALLLLLPACPGDDAPDPDEQGEVSGTLTPYRGEGPTSTTARAPAPLISLAREALRVRQDLPALPLEAVGPHALPRVSRPMPLARLPRGPRAVPGELLVELAPAPAAARARPAQLAEVARAQVQAALEAAALADLRVEHAGFISRTLHRVRLRRRSDGQAPGEQQLQGAARQLRAQPGVRSVALNRRVYRLATPDDTYFDLQWHYRLMNLPAAWDLRRLAGDVVVAVVDTGRRPHPDLDARLLPGYDFISDAANAADGDGRDPDALDQGGDLPTGGSSFHGTHVMGTVGAATDNGAGVSGVTWGGRLLPLRALGRFGGDSADVLAAMRWAAGLEVPGVPQNPNPAKVVNLSLGSEGAPDPAYQTVIDELATSPRVPGGTVVVIAAGNDNVDAAQSNPCNQARIICVGAVGFSGARARYSDFGAAVDVMAPGGDMREDLNGDRRPDGVLSTEFDESGAPAYAYLQGTSMAAPHVSGLVALMAAARGSANPLTPAEAETLLKETANEASQCAEGCGAGLVNALGAIARAADTPPSGPARLAVSSQELGFRQGGRETLALYVSNVGGGTLTATAAAGGPEGARLRFPQGTRVSVPAGETRGLQVAVDFSGLAAGTSEALITVDAGAAGSVPVTVRLRAGTFVDRDAVVVFVGIDENGVPSEALSETTLAPAAEGYRYSRRLDPRSYYVVAGIDDDRDGEFFESGERTGFWRNTDEVEPVEVTAGARITGIDFDMVPDVSLSGVRVTSEGWPQGTAGRLPRSMK